MDIRELYSLPVRAKNALRSAGIISVDQLEGISQSDLMSIRNLGKHVFNDIKKTVLYELGGSIVDSKFTIPSSLNKNNLLNLKIKLFTFTTKQKELDPYPRYETIKVEIYAYTEGEAYSILNNIPNMDNKKWHMDQIELRPHVRRVEHDTEDL